MTLRQVAEHLGITYRQVWRLVRQGELRACRQNWAWQVEGDDLPGPETLRVMLARPCDKAAAQRLAELHRRGLYLWARDVRELRRLNCEHRALIQRDGNERHARATDRPLPSRFADVESLADIKRWGVTREPDKSRPSFRRALEQARRERQQETEGRL